MVKQKQLHHWNGYEVLVWRRTRQKRLKLSVKMNGEILLTCGRTIPERLLQEFVAQSHGWLEQALATCKIHQAEFTAKQEEARGHFLVGGQTYQKTVIAGKTRKVSFVLAGSRFMVFTPDGNALVWEKKLAKFLRLYSREILTARVQYQAKRMNLYPTGLGFRAQRTRWGSCTSAGYISLNLRLCGAPLFVIDYVVIHELAHLIVPNHSAYFWRIVQRFCPMVKSAKKWLKENQLLLDQASPV